MFEKYACITRLAYSARASDHVAQPDSISTGERFAALRTSIKVWENGASTAKADDCKKVRARMFAESGISLM